MDVVRAFTYIFDDDEWVSKVLATAIISIIPIVNFALYGWIVELVDNVINGYENPMPGWDDFGEKFSAGLTYFIAALIYNLPIILISCVLGFIGGLFEGSGAGEAIIASLVCVMTIGIFAYVIATSLALFIGMVRYTRDRSLNAYLRFRENLQIGMDNLGTLITLVLLSIVAGIVIGLFAWIPCIGWLAAIALGTPVYGHLQGQAAREIVGKRKRDDYSAAY
jgi:hypothetical protein